MAHTFEHSGITFIYNSDLSGDVTILQPGPTSLRTKRIDVPGVALLAFVAEHIRREKIRDLENASDFDILVIGK